VCTDSNKFKSLVAIIASFGEAKMRPKVKAYATIVTAFLVFSFTTASIVAGAGSLTLPSTPQAPGGSVPVSGTGFNATKAVGIGFGAEVAGSNTNMAYNGTADGLTWSGRISHWPIKPGSFVLISDTTAGGSGIVSTYTDKGDGTMTWSYDGTTMGTINYVTGQWSRTTTVDVTGIAANYTATYIYYQYNATPAAGVTTTASGTFATSITVPTVTNGSYNVTAIDAGGTRAVGTITVDVTIPEGLTVAVTVLLSSFAVIGSSRYLRKPPRIPN